jgi:copper oxidase (laccase) domain-containing protein
MGIARGILPATARMMREAHGCDPADIRACVGPTIGPEVYEVGEEVAAQVQAAVPEPVLTRRAGHPKPYLNMWKAAEAQLRGAGIGQVEVAQLCTASNTDEWFSHRAEQGKTGRFGVVIQLDE